MNIKRNVVFSLETKKKNGKQITENLPIRMRIMYAGQRIEIFTGYRIDEAKWDTDKQRVTNNCTNKLKQSASDINSDLNKFFTDIQAIFKECEIQNRTPTPKQLKEEFNRKQNRRIKGFHVDRVLDVFDEFIEERSTQNNWTKATITKFTTIKNNIKKFDEFLTFVALDENRLTDYVNFLRDKKEMRNSTIEKQVKFFRWFLLWATKKGYNRNNTFESFKPNLKAAKKKVIFLSWEELTQLREYEIPEAKNYLDRVRDVFLFQCYTGLRYSDVYNLKRSDIKGNQIEITTIKTADSLIIELNAYSLEILEKYKDFHFENNKVLPVISNQKMNDYLKELAELADINEPVRETYYKGNKRIDEVTPKYALLGTHAGRRTFICNSLCTYCNEMDRA